MGAPPARWRGACAAGASRTASRAPSRRASSASSRRASSPSRSSSSGASSRGRIGDLPAVLERMGETLATPEGDARGGRRLAAAPGPWRIDRGRRGLAARARGRAAARGDRRRARPRARAPRGRRRRPRLLPRPVGRAGPARGALEERLRRFGESFRSVAKAQIEISAVNTVLTALFLFAILPVFGVRLPLAGTLVAITFLCGLIPVAGNLVSNTVIVLVSLGVSPWAGLVSLVFLVVDPQARVPAEREDRRRAHRRVRVGDAPRDPRLRGGVRDPGRHPRARRLRMDEGGARGSRAGVASRVRRRTDDRAPPVPRPAPRPEDAVRDDPRRDPSCDGRRLRKPEVHPGPARRGLREGGRLVRRGARTRSAVSPAPTRCWSS